jgi:hypothetical protein
MLVQLTKQKRIPARLSLITELSDMVYYLTGGHPKCAKQMLIALVERGCVNPTPEEWDLLYRELVITTIHAEMLKPIGPELMKIIWNLCIFRHFDQRLLGSLLDRGVLPSQAEDISRQARELRSKLEQINLFDVDPTTSTIVTNYVMRRALSINMQHDAPDLYKTLNMLALEIFFDRFQSSEAGTGKQIERTALNLLEILHHWTKLLEMDMLIQPGSLPACVRIEEAFKNYLQLALIIIQPENHSAFFKFLRDRWKNDQELLEDIRRATNQEDCAKRLTEIIEKYISDQEEATD